MSDAEYFNRLDNYIVQAKLKEPKEIQEKIKGIFESENLQEDSFWANIKLWERSVIRYGMINDDTYYRLSVVD